MDFLDALSWLADPASWTGPEGIAQRLVEHLLLSLVPVLIAVVVAAPALWLGHVGRGQVLAVNTSNIGRALPSLALLGMFSALIPRGYSSIWPTIITLVALAVPPLVTNFYVGVRGVDRGVVDAARGTGLTERQILTRVEVPLAAPLIMAGIRTSTVQVIATAALAALFAQGGLGRFIVDGQATGRYDVLIGGAILVAALALVADVLLGAVERRFARRARPTAARGPVAAVAIPDAG